MATRMELPPRHAHLLHAGTAVVGSNRRLCFRAHLHMLAHRQSAKVLPSSHLMVVADAHNAVIQGEAQVAGGLDLASRRGAAGGGGEGRHPFFAHRHALRHDL